MEVVFLPTHDRVKDQDQKQWQEFRPRPQNLTFMQMAKRMVWNPWWNETLFITSCAERLIKDEQEYGVHSTAEIISRIRQDVEKGDFAPDAHNHKSKFFQFRLIFVSRQNVQLEKHILFTSNVVPLDIKNDIGNDVS